jgi:PTS system nitrogen regulatory IIA component
MDGEPATLFILLVSPENLRGPHVKALANVSRLLKEESVRDSLRLSETPAQFLTRLRDAEAQFIRVEPFSSQPPG